MRQPYTSNRPFNNKKTYDPGRLRHKIAFIQDNIVDDGAGGTTTIQPTPNVLLETWAGKDKISPYNQAAIQSGASVFNGDYYFVIRNRENFFPDKTMQVRFEEKVYTILGVVKMDDPCTFIQILCAYSY